MRPPLSIIIPVLNEAPRLAAFLQTLRPLRQRGARVVVVDGGSDDDTLIIAREHADLVLTAPRGRASQMNAGAAASPGEVLLFLHADTQLPANADHLVRRATLGRFGWGRFDVQIDGGSAMFKVVATAMNLRSRWFGIATGDQALFVRRNLFERVGGFPDIALMEDIELSRRLKSYGRPSCIRETVKTSGRRWERHGVWRTIFLMWRLRAAYFFGADPAQLALRYGYRPRQH
jgi:rSAM/selenodomain-associated transferase 2